MVRLKNITRNESTPAAINFITGILLRIDSQHTLHLRSGRSDGLCFTARCLKSGNFLSLVLCKYCRYFNSTFAATGAGACGISNFSNCVTTTADCVVNLIFSNH